MQGGFVFLNIAFGYDNPAYYSSPGRGIEFPELIFRNLYPYKIIVFMRSIAKGLTNLGQVFEIDDVTYNPSQSTINCGKVEC